MKSSDMQAPNSPKKLPVLYFIIPCYNEAEVLPKTAPQFLKKVNDLIAAKAIDRSSKVVFVNDGSTDATWDIIELLAQEHNAIEGLCLSRNRGHQNALIAGLMTCRERCDITISIDCDGQDDLNAADAMVAAYNNQGCDIVYGVRDDRSSDSFFKRNTALAFYRFMGKMGVESVFNHADYRLLSRKALEALAQFREVNLFLRGMVPLIGFKSTSVTYTRKERIAGRSHYPLSKMVALAVNGITSLSAKPIHLISGFGFIVSLASIVAILWALVEALIGNTVSGWTSIVILICFFGGMQLLALGVIGEYVGKTYLETKHRPRFIIEKDTERDN